MARNCCLGERLATKLRVDGKRILGKSQEAYQTGVRPLKHHGISQRSDNTFGDDPPLINGAVPAGMYSDVEPEIGQTTKKRRATGHEGPEHCGKTITTSLEGILLPILKWAIGNRWKLNE